MMRDRLPHLFLPAVVREQHAKPSPGGAQAERVELLKAEPQPSFLQNVATQLGLSVPATTGVIVGASALVLTAVIVAVVASGGSTDSDPAPTPLDACPVWSVSPSTASHACSFADDGCTDGQHSLGAAPGITLAGAQTACSLV